MKYSILVPYRDRETHLNIFAPKIKEFFRSQNIPVELIVAEQTNSDIFRRGNLRNYAAMYATGELFVFHDIDYIPIDSVYYIDNVDVYLPVKQAEFCYNNLEAKPLNEVPSGYRHFKDSVDNNFFGAVVTIKRDKFFSINGYPTKFVGWGCEDSTLGERVKYYNLHTERGSGKFKVLDHPDSQPDFNDVNFINNMRLAVNWKSYLSDGINNMTKEHSTMVPPKHPDVDVWIECDKFEVEIPPTNKIIASILE